MTDRTINVLAALAVAVFGAIVYANTFDGEWVWDDASSVLLHKHVQDPAKLAQLFREDQHAFGAGQGNFYRPLVSVSFMLDYWFSHDPSQIVAPQGHPDISPMVFHLTNLLWHLLASLLLLALLVRLRAPAWVRIFAPILFVVHPLHTEAVAYISGRADMMSAAFIFAALLAATTAASGPRRYAAWGGSAIFFIGGLLSKESSSIYPVLLALVLLAAPTEGARAMRPAERFAPLILAGVLLALYIFLRVTSLNFAEPGVASAAAPLAQRLVETLQSFALYIQLLFWPLNLHMERTLHGVGTGTAIAGLVLLLAFLAAAVAAWRSGHRRITLGFAWFLAAWLPISGIFPLNAPMAEHWMYVPMAGFWWALLEGVALFTRTPATRRLATAAACILAAILSVLAVARNNDWHDNESLYSATLAQNPRSFRVQFNLGVEYQDLQKDPAAARRHFQAAWDLITTGKAAGAALSPAEAEIALSLGDVLSKSGDYPEAIEAYNRLVSAPVSQQMAPEVAQALMGIARCSLAIGNLYEASRALGQASKMIPALTAEAEALSNGAALFAYRR